ncbi:MAG: hypothetical protein EB127_25160, partial [Alphaproteobacteria bacterium]|nr:hypothetical protein [Alphaproteobacteria bacterium]
AEIGNDPGSFSSALSNKEQIRISFPVNSKTQMLTNSSSIYYFSPTNGTWNIPEGARTQHSGTFQNFSYRTVWNPSSGTYGYRSTNGTKFLEDYKGFDPFGRAIASGNLDVYRQVSSQSEYNQTISGLFSITTTNDTAKVVPYLAENYPKSFQRSSNYNAKIEECFELNVSNPFLIEKLALEIPLELGETWFKDLTVASLAVASGTYASSTNMPPFDYYDKGGPAITVSLMCQKKYGEETIRDLIATKVITHHEDFIGTSRARLYRLPYTENGVSQPYITLDYYGIKDKNVVIVQKNLNNQYTGSVKLELTPAISNGASATLGSLYIIFPSLEGAPSNLIPYVDNFDSFLNRMRNISSKEDISLSDLKTLASSLIVSGIDPFGRGMTGFSPSGGSIFGKEYSTPQNPDKFKNPFYVEDSQNREDTISAISGSISAISSSYPFVGGEVMWVNLFGNASFFYSSSNSPYLMNPGDKLVLSISKTRPAIESSKHNVPNSVSADTGYQNLISYTP